MDIKCAFTQTICLLITIILWASSISLIVVYYMMANDPHLEFLNISSNFNLFSSQRNDAAFGEDYKLFFNLKSIGYNINELDKEKTTIIIQSYCSHGDINRMNILLYILARYRTYCLVLHDIVLIWGCNQNEINDIMLQKIRIINESKLECNEPNSNHSDYKWFKPMNDTDYYSNLKTPNIYVYIKMNSTLSHRWKVLNYHKFRTLTATSHDDDRIFNELHFYCYLHAFNMVQFNITDDNKQNVFHLNDINNRYSNNMPIIGVFGRLTRHYFDLNDWNNKTKRKQYIDQLNDSIGIHPLLEKRMFFHYSAWSNAPYKDYAFDAFLPGNGLFIPIYLYHIIHDMLNKYNLINIIDNQPAMCDDIGYALALYYYFSGDQKNKLFLKWFNPNNYPIGYYARTQFKYMQNKYPLLDMILREWQQKYQHYNGTMQSTKDYYDMEQSEISIRSNDIEQYMNIQQYRLSNRQHRLEYRHECINLMIWQYKKQHLNDTNFPNSLNIHRHFVNNSAISIPCFCQQ